MILYIISETMAGYVKEEKKIWKDSSRASMYLPGTTIKGGSEELGVSTVIQGRKEPLACLLSSNLWHTAHIVGDFGHLIKPEPVRPS